MVWAPSTRIHFFFLNLPSVHMYPINPARESATFGIHSPEWNFMTDGGIRIFFIPMTFNKIVRCVGRGGGCVGCDHTPLPTGRKGPPGKNLFGWKMWTCEKNAKDEQFSSNLSLCPMFFSAVDHLELCSCYWFICRDPLTVAFCHSRNCKRIGLIHPNSPIRQCSNECFGQSIFYNLPNTVVAQ